VQKVRTWLAVTVLLSAVFLVYSNHFHNAFHFDDFHSITNNVAIRSLSHVPEFFVDARASSVFPSHQAWRPLVTTSLAIDYWLGHGYNPFYFQLSGFLWFLALLLCAASLFRSVLDRAEPKADRFFIAWFAVAWYGLHPAMAETVNYIIQRADIMSTCGMVAGLAIYARFPAWRRRGVYLLPVALGLLAKPPALIFPAMLAAYLFLIEEGASRESWPRVLRGSVPALALSLAFVALQSAMTPKSFNAGAGSAFHYAITQPYVWFRYFTSFFLPLQLSADTDLQPLESLFTLEAAGGFLFVGFLLFSIYLAAKRPAGRPAAFGLCWFVLGLIPTSIFPLAEVENDHRMFLPFVGLALAVSWTGYRVARRILWSQEARAAIAAAAICLLVLCGAGTWRRNQVWHTEDSLWEDVTLKSPRNGRGLMNYGLARMSQGDFKGALTYFERAHEYTPNYPDLEINLGIDYGALGQDTEAERHFHRAIELAPGDAQVHFFYGRWLKEKRRDEQAVSELRRAILLYPSDLEARLLLLDTYAGQSAWSLLTPLAMETLKLAPGDPGARRYAEMKPAQAMPAAPPPLPTPESLLNLSLAAYQKKDFENCIRFAELALKERPAYAEAYNNLIAAYNSLGRWDDAIAAGQQALRLKPDYPLARNNLLWAVAQKNRQARTGR
jgi:protein O-mannosyl-transferase